MEKSKIEFRQRRDLGEVISATMQFIAENFLHLNGHLLMLVAPFLLIGLMINKLMPSDWLFSSVSGFIGFTFLSAVGVLLFYALLVAVLYAYLMLYEQKGAKNFNLNELVRKALKIVPNILSTFFWLIFLAFLGFLVLGILLSVMGVIFAFGGILSSLIMFLLLMLPIVYFGLHFLFTFVIRLEEELSVIQSIQRSFTLIKGRFWETLGVFFVCLLIQLAISYAILLPIGAFSFMGSLFNANDGAEAISQALMIYYGISFVINIFTSIIPILAISLQYYSLIERTESKGLVAQIETIGTKKDDSLDEEQY